MHFFSQKTVAFHSKKERIVPQTSKLLTIPYFLISKSQKAQLKCVDCLDLKWFLEFTNSNGKYFQLQK